MDDAGVCTRARVGLVLLVHGLEMLAGMGAQRLQDAHNDLMQISLTGDSGPIWHIGRFRLWLGLSGLRRAALGEVDILARPHRRRRVDI